MTRKFGTFATTLVTIVTSLVTLTWAQGPGRRLRTILGTELHLLPPIELAPLDTRARRRIPALSTRCITGITSRSIRAGSITRRSREGDPRVFGEQLGPGRSSRAMAIVHIAMFDAVNAIARRYRSYTGIRRRGAGRLHGRGHRTGGTRYARRDVPVAEGPAAMRSSPKSSRRSPTVAASRTASASGSARRARFCARAGRRWLGADRAAPRHRFHHQRSPRQVAAGSHQPDPDRARRPLGRRQAVRRAQTSRVQGSAAARADQPRLRGSVQRGEAPRRRRRDDARRERTADQTLAGIYWAYDGTPSLCAPPRLYNQIAVTIADQMGTDVGRSGAAARARQRRDVRCRVSPAGNRSITTSSGVRSRASASRTAARARPAAATATRSRTATRRSRHSGRRRAIFRDRTSRRRFPPIRRGTPSSAARCSRRSASFYRTDDIAFTFTSDELNGVTLDNQGNPTATAPAHVLRRCRRRKRRTARAASISGFTGRSTRRKGSRRAGASPATCSGTPSGHAGSGGRFERRR